MFIFPFESLARKNAKKVLKYNPIIVTFSLVEYKTERTEL